MFVLCLIGLIIVWGYVWYLSKQPAQPPAKPGPVSLITGTLC